MLASYFYARECDERYGYKMEMASPILYGIGSIFFGIIPMIWLWIKVYHFRKYNY
jgi:hypothetical protein